jgi:hypothetical protein
MQVTYDLLAKGQFQQLWARLVSTPTNQKASYWIGRWHTKLDSIRKQMVTDFQKNVAEKFGEKDEKGNFKAPQQPVDGFFFENGIMISEANRKEYNEALVKLGQTEAEIDFEPMPRAFLDDIKIAPVEEPLLDGIFESLEAHPTVHQLKKVADR